MENSRQLTVANRCKRKKSLTNDGVKGFLFILPNLCGYFFLTLLPVFFAFGISFTKWDFYQGFSGIQWYGINNYIRLFTDKWFIASFTNNIIYSVFTIPALLILSLLFAVALNAKIYCKNFSRTMIFMPYVVNTVAVAAIGLLLFNANNGPINAVLRSMGIANPPGWLSSLDSSLPAVMIMSVWQGIGYDMIIYLSGLQAIPNELYESATIDGANGFQKLLHVTVPLLHNTTFFLLITNIISSFQVFGIINILTQGGPGTSTTVLAYYIYRLAFVYNKMGPASAVAMALFVMILIVTLIQWRTQRKMEKEVGY